jgi:hypothetical protein
MLVGGCSGALEDNPFGIEAELHQIVRQHHKVNVTLAVLRPTRGAELHMHGVCMCVQVCMAHKVCHVAMRLISIWLFKKLGLTLTQV